MKKQNFTRLDLALLITVLCSSTPVNAMTGEKSHQDDIGSTQKSSADRVVDLKTEVESAVVWGLAFSNDGKSVAVGSAEQVDIWDWQKRSRVTTLHPPKGSDSFSKVKPLQFSVDGKLLFACGSRSADDVIIRVWNSRDWSIARDVKNTEVGGCNGISLSSDGKFLAYAVDTNRPIGQHFVVLDLQTWSMSWVISLDGLYTPMAISFSPDSHTLAFSGYTTSINPADKDGVEGVPRFLFKSEVQLADVSQQKVQRKVSVQALAPLVWSPDGSRLAVADGGIIEFIDVATGKVFKHFAENTSHMDATYSPDGMMFLDSDSNGRGTGRGLYIWNADRSRLLQRVAGQHIGPLAFSRDGRYFAVGDRGRITIWQVR
jgi:WD40 repeat protein